MWIISIIVILLCLLYIFYLRQQIRGLNASLLERFHLNSDRPIQIELMDKELNSLTKNINSLLLREQRVRIKSKQEEKYYKELVSNISHDFRTPLTAVKGYQQMLRATPLSPEQLAKLDIAEKHVRRLEQLLGIFFEYSYLLSNELEPKREQVNVGGLIQETVAGLFSEIEGKGLQFTLPGETKTIVVQTDEAMLLRIIQNLVRNCITHSSGDVDIQYWQHDDLTFIQFKNPFKGTGYVQNTDETPFNPNQFFDRFYTADASRIQNTGLGLSIVKLLAEKLGGQAKAEIHEDKIAFTIEVKSDISQ